MTNEVIEVVAVAGKKDYTHMPMRESLVAKAAQLRETDGQRKLLVDILLYILTRHILHSSY